MKLNHINLVVTDVAAATQFFEKYFDFRCIEVKGNDAISILKGTDDFSLVLMKSKDADIQYPRAFHIGFMLSGRRDMSAIHAKMKDDGLDVGTEPANIRNSYGFYFTFGSIMIEVGCHLED